MAKVIIEFDTNEKSCQAKIDGKSIDNVVGISFYQGYNDPEEYSFRLTTVSKDEENDMRTYTYLIASETQEGKNKYSQGQATESAHAGFLKARAHSKVLEDISKFLRS